jgi:hypothetical protein
MTERPISKSDILGAFERAYEKKLRSDQEVDWKGMFKVVPLVPEGTSIWARLLREKKVEAWTVLWAMIPPEDNGTITEENPKGRVTWMAARITIPEVVKAKYPGRKFFLFNLANAADRQSFQRIAQEIEFYTRYI